MKAAVVGGTGLIGSMIVDILRDCGDEVIAASPKGGVNTVTGARRVSAGSSSKSGYDAGRLGSTRAET